MIIIWFEDIFRGIYYMHVYLAQLFFAHTKVRGNIHDNTLNTAAVPLCRRAGQMPIDFFRYGTVFEKCQDIYSSLFRRRPC